MKMFMRMMRVAARDSVFRRWWVPLGWVSLSESAIFAALAISVAENRADCVVWMVGMVLVAGLCFWFAGLSEDDDDAA